MSSDARFESEPAEFGLAGRLAAIGAGTERLLDNLRATGPDAPVPTCPDWTMRDLVLHLGMVHRWAGNIVANAITDFADARDDFAPAQPEPDVDDLADWLAEGSAALLDALTAAPDDLAALVFIKAAPAPRDFWARRQANETTIHGVDALAGRLGRIPTTKEADIPTDLALDGLEELLVGFLPRKSSAMRAESPVSFLVAPSDAAASWTVRLSPEPPVVVRGADGEPDAVMTGTAATLYLGLWNRGDEIAVTGEPELLGVWRDKTRILWS
ncbi:maleylpyruvate isomerase family mycothiol-dependent enzyme [Nakamurella lactea]|jgi:uncharacterized protein (TIGR03083 family)|uniref:maleylpyruvate isomerase family mycothiol-dependent enzyme n=1 Tax=Nakamurella lactea TaxID=459515 RepID=UPI000425AFC0|nr:maleylpyruvate isomerase family mycothiol-dependent enzyme [Nakamurella lactea]